MKKLLLCLVVLCVFGSFTQKEIRWLALGDSITYLNDHVDETGNRVKEGYMTRVVRKLPYISYINQGHNGWTAVNIAKEAEHLGLVKADVYSVFLGTNDWWAGIPVGTMDDYMNNAGNNTAFGAFRTIVNNIKRLNDQAKIILITPMQRADFVYLGDMKNNAWGSYKEKNGQSLEQFAGAVKVIGQYEGFEVIDLYHEKELVLNRLVKFKRLKDPQTGKYEKYKYPDFIAIPFNPLTDEYPYPAEAVDMTYDGLHPSDQGNEIIAAMLVKVMENWFGK